MIGLDTNFLVRYIVHDDVQQLSKVLQTIANRLTDQNPGFVSLVTVMETVWVLSSFYKFTDAEIAQAMERLLQTEVLFVQNEREVHAAMEALRSGQGSFDDALIGTLGLWAGCTTTLTFDKRASRLQGFELIA